MERIEELVGNKADDLAMQFYDKPFYELDKELQDKVWSLAELAVDIQIAHDTFKGDPQLLLDKTRHLQIAYFQEYGGT